MSALVQRVMQQPWRLWSRQVDTIVRIELRKNFFSRRGFGLYALAFGPVVIIALHAFFDHSVNMREDTMVLAGIFQFYYLRLAIFFGCMGIFTRLIRGEMVERSLHYYLLAPVRRELLVVAKFIAGAITAVSFFGLAVFASFVLMYGHFGPAGINYLNGPGLHQLVSYVGITVLACIGYGALFLALSMVFRNPIAPGLVVMGWEALNPILPPLLQKISIIFYLRHLTPVDVPVEGIFALLTVVTEPVPAWAAVWGVLCVTVLVLILACYLVRGLEISYTTD